ncbi:site-specific integrase [Jeotgalibaca sp. MA1X17-3]|uniref:site-specific integrase n=1 Tax=Jeotgalibaca sp. MA1X17-3 TaxID=2908211 RepID=UPI001F293C8E|nr:site-specific integrase [Jeotgalibaca sp. MA1X17-3]UJF15014.1 site-specific integrase [Jeotgalibaca sp. MA1X17-3]
MIIQPPKTKAGVRIISIDEHTLKILKQWKKQQLEDYFKLGFNTNKGSQLIFSTLENEYIQQAVVNNAIVKTIERHGLKKITTHGLRHTHCSLLFEAGAPIQVVKERLGHSDIQTTMNIYTHVTERAKEDTAKMFAEYVNF